MIQAEFSLAQAISALTTRVSRQVGFAQRQHELVPEAQFNCGIIGRALRPFPRQHIFCGKCCDTRKELRERAFDPGKCGGGGGELRHDLAGGAEQLEGERVADPKNLMKECLERLRWISLHLGQRELQFAAFFGFTIERLVLCRRLGVGQWCRCGSGQPTPEPAQEGRAAAFIDRVLCQIIARERPKRRLQRDWRVEEASAAPAHFHSRNCRLTHSSNWLMDQLAQRLSAGSEIAQFARLQALDLDELDAFATGEFVDLAIDDEFTVSI